MSMKKLEEKEVLIKERIQESIKRATDEGEIITGMLLVLQTTEGVVIGRMSIGEDLLAGLAVRFAEDAAKERGREE